MKITYLVSNENQAEGWQEDYETDSVATPTEIIVDLIAKFNATLRPKEKPRHLVQILSVEKSPPKPIGHIWDKASLVTERGGYDRMRCRACGATGKRYGLGQGGVTIDKRAKKSCPGYDL